MNLPDKSMLQNYFTALIAEADKVFPGNEFFSAVIMHGKGSIIVQYPDSETITIDYNPDCDDTIKIFCAELREAQLKQEA